MKESVRKELQKHIKDTKLNLTVEEIKEELHYHCFNKDHYLIGYYQCSQWLKRHGMGEFSALEELQELQLDYFGEIHPLENINSEVVVNQLAYFYGLELT